jgi:hypothetical protein
VVSGFEIKMCVVHDVLSNWIGFLVGHLFNWVIIQKFFQSSDGRIFSGSCVKNWDLQCNAVKILLYIIF